MAAFAQVNESPAQRAQRIYLEAEKQFRQQPDNTQLAWQFGRACFDRAEFASKSSERAAIAEQGIAACRAAIDKDPKSAPAHYYLALNLGQLAQTKSLGALRLVDEMEKELKTVIALDPTFDYAGPHRSLGLLYTDAPSWPISLGSRTNAERHLLKAVELSPTYPDNHLSLIEAYLKWDDKKAARSLLIAAAKALEESREKLTGEEWSAAWRDWDRRRKKIKTQLGKIDGSE